MSPKSKREYTAIVATLYKKATQTVPRIICFKKDPFIATNSMLFKFRNLNSVAVVDFNSTEISIHFDGNARPPIVNFKN